MLPISDATMLDKSCNISGEILLSMFDSCELANRMASTSKTDKPAPTRLLCFILDEMAVMSAPNHVAIVIGSKGINSVPKTTSK